MVVKGRKLSIGPAVKRQRSPTSSCSTEKISPSPGLEEPSVVSSNLLKCHPKSNHLKFKNNRPGLNNWSVPYYLETSGFMSGTQLSLMDPSSGNPQVNSTQPYQSYVYVPPYAYQEAAGYSYAPYSFPDSMPVVAVPMPDYCMYRDMQLR